MNRIKCFKLKLSTDTFWQSLFKNSFWALLGDSSATLVSLIISIIIIKLIGTNQYGEFMLAQTYMYIVDTIFNIQSWQGVIYYGQHAIVKHRTNELYGIIKLGVIVDLATALFGGVIAVLIATSIGQALNWNPVIASCAVIFSYTIFSHFSGTPTGILRLLDKFNLVALQKILSAIIKLLSLFVLLINGETNLLTVTIIYVIGDSIGNLLLVIFAACVYSRQYSLKKLANAKLPDCASSFIKYTLWSTLNGIVDLPVSYLDVFIVSILGTAQVAIYKVFKQIVGILSRITSPIQQASLPQFTNLVAHQKSAYGFQIVLKISRTVVKYLSLPILFIGLSSPLWLNLIYGTEYATYWWVLASYLIIQLFALSFTTIHPFFFALGKARESTLYIAIANLLYFTIALLTIRQIGLFSMIIAYIVQVSCAIGFKYLTIKKGINHVKN